MRPPPIAFVTMDDIMWAAGQLDGDGSVGLYDNRLRVMLTKAEKGWTALDRFQQLFGGIILKGHLVSDRHQWHRVWILREDEAFDFCQKMARYTVIKRREYELACTAPVGRTPFLIQKGGIEVLAKNMQAIQYVVGLKRCQLWRNFKQVEGMCGNGASQARDERTGRIVINGWTIQRLHKADIQDYRALKVLKTTPHDEIHEQLTPSYVAGFIDAEGCIMLRKTTPLLTTSQKY